jgi:hypothetical protein
MAFSPNGVVQSPTPIIVQAANSAAAATSTISRPATAGDDLQSLSAAIKLLEQIKSSERRRSREPKSGVRKVGGTQGKRRPAPDLRQARLERGDA